MENIVKAKQLVNEATVVIVTAGNKLAKSEGLDLLGQAAFVRDFPTIAWANNVHSVGAALGVKMHSWSEQWQLWGKLIQKYSLDYRPSRTMRELKQVIGKKKFFVATSTFGHFFEAAGFNDKRIFNAFGDWTKMQCSSGINHGLEDSREVVRKFSATDNEQKIAALVPKCSVCGQPMELHMPLNDHFYPDSDANARFRWFLTGNEEEKVVFLELGVDETSPQLLEPIIRLVEQFPQWSYVAADLKQEELPQAIQ
ncbi:Sir2 family NAD-dependent protein deacetylase, partial [Lactobacillus sp. XV13L]|nr:Sir2 family NAD-dependent protein deacetylase [Lactobacillus sp. XV13L]